MSDTFEKKSWSQVDKLKEKGGQNFSKKTSSHHTRDQSLAKKNLDDLFKPKANPEAQKAWKKIQALPAQAFEKEAPKYIETFGYPKDGQAFLPLLDIEDPAFLLPLLSHLEKVSLDLSPSSQEMIKGKLRISKMMLDDQACLDLMDLIVERLS